MVVAGADLALARHPACEFLFFGDASQLTRWSMRTPSSRRRRGSSIPTSRCAWRTSRARRCATAAGNRRCGSPSMRSKKGDADMAVSAGNTGALMAMSKFDLKTLPGIEHPAIAALWPTLRRRSIVLDVGATIGADAEHLVDLAVMGAATARVLFGLPRPSVGLLNIGVEEAKGLEQVREAGRILREEDVPGLDYHGFVEGDDIGRGKVDVVVTEGFAGNIALKTAEGTARQTRRILQASDEQFVECPRRLSFRAVGIPKLAWRRGSAPRQWRCLPRARTASLSKVTAAPMPKVLRRPSTLGHGVVQDELLTKSRTALSISTSLRSRSSAERPRDNQALGYARLRQLSAEQGSHQRRDRPQDRHLGRMDRPAHRHSRAPHRRARRSDLANGGARGAGRARACACGCAVDRPDRAGDLDARRYLPASAVAVQADLGITHGAAFDLQAVCSGFVYGLATVDALLRTGAFSRALLIGSETFSRILDWTDRGTCVLFGDGAGAVVLQAARSSRARRRIAACSPCGSAPTAAINRSSMSTAGRHHRHRRPAAHGGQRSVPPCRHQIADVVRMPLKITGYTAADVDWFIPHQANQRILDGSARKLGIRPGKVSPPSIATAIPRLPQFRWRCADAVADRRIKRGDLLLFEAMGGGFTWGAALVRW